jgi:transposase
VQGKYTCGETRLLLHDLNDSEWAIIKSHIPREVTNSRSSPLVLRATVNAVLWRMRTGSPWHTVPKEYGERVSIHRRFVNWNETGVWVAIAKALAEVRATGQTDEAVSGSSADPPAQSEAAAQRR